MIESGIVVDTTTLDSIIREAFQKSLQAKRLRDPRDLAVFSGLAIEHRLSPVGLLFGRTTAAFGGQKEVRR